MSSSGRLESLALIDARGGEPHFHLSTKYDIRSRKSGTGFYNTVLGGSCPATGSLQSNSIGPSNQDKIFNLEILKSLMEL